ncbi:MAG: four helix bundle protein [Deltaproteobacteria bacterium]|nr:four helix bundle protein [Deltaproteobacteria bacterium]
MSEQIKSAKDLRVYKRAYALSMEIFELSRAWPAEEKYSLTDADGENPGEIRYAETSSPG